MLVDTRCSMVEKLYKLSEFARTMGVSRSAVIKWIKQGKSGQLTFTAGGTSQNQNMRGLSEDGRESWEQLSKLLKTIERTAILESWANKFVM